MPGAQPRRPFETRMASTARRGALVPNGVPGVYRVPRRGRVALVAADPGSAASVSEWVQPEDQTVTVDLYSIYQTYNYSDGSLPYGVSIVNLAVPDTNLTAASGADTPPFATGWGVFAVIVDPSECAADPVSPTAPPGMTVEYENPEGVLLTALIRGSINNKGVGSTSTSAVWEIPYATMVPGVDAGAGTGDFVTGPEYDVGSGTQVFSRAIDDPEPGFPGFRAEDFETPPQDFPTDPDLPRVGWKIGPVSAHFETLMDPGEQHLTRLYGPLSNPLDEDSVTVPIEVEYTYRPPRYRFV